MSYKCPKCNKSINANSSFCSHCGTPFYWPSADINCSKCNAQLNPGSNYCPGCGGIIDWQKFAKANNVHCSNCNALLNPGTKFCPGCGNTICWQNFHYSQNPYRHHNDNTQIKPNLRSALDLKNSTVACGILFLFSYFGLIPGIYTLVKSSSISNLISTSSSDRVSSNRLSSIASSLKTCCSWVIVLNILALLGSIIMLYSPHDELNSDIFEICTIARIVGSIVGIGAGISLSSTANSAIDNA